jgi:CheY-like chemotaxis protein
LIVDDMAQVRQDLLRVLQLVGEEGGISSGRGRSRRCQEAIRQARVLQPEVVLMDLVMPVLMAAPPGQSKLITLPSVSSS